MVAARGRDAARRRRRRPLAQRRLAPRSFPPPGTRGAGGIGARRAVRGRSPLPELPPRDLLPPLRAAGRAAPTEDELGVTLYPNSTYLASFDAGRGQEFHLFGTNATFTNMVRYYRVILRDRGDEVFEAPRDPPVRHRPRFDDDRMDLPAQCDHQGLHLERRPPGYPNPLPGADPPTFATIIQFTTAPPDPRRR